MDTTDTLNIFAPGHLDLADSYGLIACMLAKEISDLGVHVNVLSHGEVKARGKKLRRLLEQPIRPTFGGIFLGYPTSYHTYGAMGQYGPKVALTMFESTKLPKGWVEVLNKWDAVIVPSQFVRDVFVECGVTAPIHVVPLGILGIYRPRRRQPKRPYTFLAIADRGLRKGFDVAALAFAAAFGESEDYKLILKTRKDGVRWRILNKNIELISKDLSPKGMRDLFYQADCMVFPARGEGFGLPPREFAATGAPVIATNWSGLKDDIEQWAIPLRYSVVPANWMGAKNLEGQDLGDWAEPDMEHLIELMLHVAENNEAVQEEAYNKAAWVIENYSWRKCAQRVYEIWREQCQHQRTNTNA